ncbi:hypothetical protein GGI17_006290 [Coemansia sp. S146]|nr:hypothetical protein GGI17_006290 [Coemansia sp. S146]
MDEVYQANVSAFMSWIKQMIPMVNDVYIEIDGCSDPDISFADHFSYLVTQLCRLGNRIEYNCKPLRDLPVESRLDEIRDLAHLRLEHNFECDRSSYLSRRNAQTLRSLCLKSWYLDDAVSLIRSPDGGYVTYPCLHTLELWEYKIVCYMEPPVFPGAVPFPSLPRLRISLPALLGDDVLFRGNSATLESLVLKVDDHIVPIFRQHSVFTPTSHPKLRYVKFGLLDRLVPELFSTYTEVVRFALSIGPGAPVRGSEEVSSANELLPALLLPGDHSSIRVLSIPNTELDTWQAISLIKSLPLLSDLQAPFPSIGSMPDGVTMNELPKYMVSTYAPMGERFRCWRIICYTSNVENIMLLALICPNFDYAAVDPEYRELFIAHMRDKIQADGFRQHEEWLRRLFFGGWENKFSNADIAQARLDAARKELFGN